MRVTTWLILDKLKVKVLALLVESYLIGPNQRIAQLVEDQVIEIEPEEFRWMSIGIGGHYELIVEKIEGRESQYDSLYLAVVKGVCMSGDIEMIKTIHAFGVTDFSGGLWAFLSNYEKDTCGHRLRVAGTLFDLDPRLKQDRYLIPATKQGDVNMYRFLISKIMPDTQSSMIVDYFIAEDLYMFAGYRGNNDLFDLVVECGHKTTHLLDTIRPACEYGNFEFVKRVIEQNIDILLGGWFDEDWCEIAAIDAIVGDQENHAEHENFNQFTNDHANIVEYLLGFGVNKHKLLSTACSYGASKSFATLVNAGATICRCGLDITDHTETYLNSKRGENLKNASSRWRMKRVGLEAI